MLGVSWYLYPCNETTVEWVRIPGMPLLLSVLEWVVNGVETGCTASDRIWVPFLVARHYSSKPGYSLHMNEIFQPCSPWCLCYVCLSFSCSEGRLHCFRVDERAPDCKRSLMFDILWWQESKTRFSTDVFCQGSVPKLHDMITCYDCGSLSMFVFSLFSPRFDHLIN